MDVRGREISYFNTKQLFSRANAKTSFRGDLTEFHLGSRESFQAHNALWRSAFRRKKSNFTGPDVFVYNKCPVTYTKVEQFIFNCFLQRLNKFDGYFGLESVIRYDFTVNRKPWFYLRMIVYTKTRIQNNYFSNFCNNTKDKSIDRWIDRSS